jgi:N-acetylmuramoyl-L-alanine amidase
VDDGFLKKIRVAQFQRGRTRVVREVDDLSDYDAFLLPNPYRLIIDIHGKDIQAKKAKSKPAKDAIKNAASDVEAAPKAGSDGDELAESKTDLLKSAGKAPVTSEDVADGTKIVSKADAANAKTTATPLVKKVVVEADDDDSAPARRKKTTTARKRPVPPAKNDATADADADPTDDKLTADDALAGPPPHKASARLASNRNATDLDIHEARPTASGDRSLIRTLGLKIGKIVIDPGHGGHDTGTIGPNGLEEKDLVLEVGRRLGKLLESRLGAEVVYTRKNDTFIPLETRTAIANQQRADLFVSIHANSSQDETARGVETYYLNFTSSPEALDVAARENAVSEKSIYELQDLVKKIALKEKIEESREFAGDVQESLHSGLAAKSPGIRNRGVKKAPFIVLIGANMPSILAEISFVSNPGDEKRLETSEYRQRIAEALYRGIAKYVNGLSGVKVASNKEKVSGQ